MDNKELNLNNQNNNNQSNSSNSNEHIIREFGLSSFAVNNVTSVLVIIFLLVVLGLGSYMAMPKENFPEIKIPQVYVGVPYPGNSPLDMENLVTRPIEKELNSINGVDKITSTSIQDYATIIVDFNMDMPVDEAVLDVKDAIDRASPDLPTDLPSEPNVFELDFSDLPILNVNISGYEDLDILKSYAEYLQEEIEKLPEVSSVDIRGVPEKEVSVNVDLHKLEARNLNFGDIEGAIARENITMSGGDVLMNQSNRNVRVDGEFKDVKEIEDIVVSNEQGKIIYLKDVAEVELAYEDAESYARAAKLPVVTCDIVKKSGENLLDAIDKTKLLVAEAKEKRFPEQLVVELVNDQSKFTRSMVNNLQNSIISGVLLVVLVLLFFMGLRNALFVGVAIPLSMLAGFMILGFSGNTLNVMVLFSLILALGMLVDNGIVVVENIYRLIEHEGYDTIRAAKEGVGEVAWPIISSTATTLAAFVPLLFWKDIMGEFMKFLPITLIIVLASSLFVALVVNPVLTSVFMKLDDGEEKIDVVGTLKWFALLVILSIVFYVMGWTSLGSLFAIAALFTLLNSFILVPLSRKFQASVMPALERAYRAFVRFALTSWRPALFLLGTFALLIGSIMILGAAGLKVELFPINEPNNIHVYIEHPIGTDIEKTNAFTKEVEDILYKELEPYNYMIESILAQVGAGTGNPNAGPQQGTSPNKSRVTVTFLEYQYRKGKSTIPIMEEVREALNGFAGVQIVVEKDQSGPPTGAAINIEVSGEDFLTLTNLSNDIKRYLDDANIAGVEELKMDLETGKPELLVNIDREKARRFGLSTAQIATTIRTAIFGKEVSKFKEGEDEYPIQLRLRKEDRYDVPTILNQKVIFRNNKGRQMQIPISSVANIEYTSTYGSVKRKDLDRVVSIYSNVTEGYNGAEIVKKYERMLQSYDLPDGYQVKFTGEQEEQQESTAFLSTAMGIAVMLIFFIIVSQFNSVAVPIIVVLSILFSTIGVFLGYVLFQMDFIIIMTGIGIISLAGVVVNNAIVLIDYTNLVRNRQRLELGLGKGETETRGQVVDAIVEAGSKRLRPVLLTAITTVLGLVPLATGLNIDFFSLLSDFDPQIYVGGDNAIFWGPMAWTVIFGLVFATFLTLIIVPVMYLILDRISTKVIGGGIG